VNTELEENVKTELEGDEVTLIQDGWSNIHNDPVIASCLHVAGKTPYYLSAVDTGSNKKTASYCAGLAREAVDLAKEKYGCHVKSLVSDNERKMEVMRKELEADDTNEIQFAYGCSSHWLNLLGQDITPDGIIKPIVDVQKYFRNHHRPGGWLAEHDGHVKPQIPGDTR